jgi:hypothetical protein
VTDADARATLGRHHLRLATQVLLLFVSLYALTLKGLTIADDLLHYDLAQYLVASGHPYLPPGKYSEKQGMRFFVARGRDNQLYLGLPNGLAFASVPFAAFGHAVDGWTHAGEPTNPLSETSEDAIREAMHALRRRPSALITTAINPLVSAATVALLFLLACRLTPSVHAAFRVTLLLGLATIVWPYSSNYWTQPLAGFFLFASLFMSYSAYRDVSRVGAAVAGALAGAAFLCRYDTLPLSPWLLACCTFCAPKGTRSRLAAGLCFLAGLGSAIALQACWNAYRFGSWLDLGTGHQRLSDFSGAVFRVMPLLVVSPYRGLLVYSPPLILGVFGLVAMARKRPVLALTIAGISATALVVYSAFVMWRGNGMWGPRYLVLITPFLLLPAAPLLERWPRAFWVLLIVGVAVQLPAVVAAQDLFTLSAFHNPLQRDPWRHFWQFDAVPQWASVLRGNVEFWWLASPSRAVVGLMCAGVGLMAGKNLRQQLRRGARSAPLVGS